jgi:N-acetylmuramoyl-L-alanine amidase
MRTPWFVLATALLLGLVAPTEAARADRAGYERAVERERALTAKAKTQTVADAEWRKVSVTFENIARRYPTSGYADNALMKAASIAEQLYERGGRDADMRRSIQLYQWLAKEYPSSPLVKQARASVRSLEVPSRPPKSTAARESRAIPAATSGVSPAATEVAQSSPLPKLRAVHRAVLPEVVRLTLELDGEVAFQHDRLDHPPRIFFDLKGAQPVATLQDAVLTYPDEVVRQVRLGPKSANTTRVVLDVDGPSRYSVFTLYNPYRVVVDLERPHAPLDAKAAVPPALSGSPSTARSPVAPPRAVRAAASTRASSTPRNAQRPAVVTFTLAPSMPVTTRVMTPGAPNVARAVEPAARETDLVRLAPEAAIASREIEVATRPVSPEALSARPTEVARDTRPAGTKTAARKSPLPKPPAASATSPTDAAVDELAAELARANGIAVPASDTRPAGPAGETEVLRSAEPVGEVPRDAPVPAPVAPSANVKGGFSLARQLGLGVGRVVIDPGHGGHDPGAINKGLSEAALVLDIAQRLEKLLTKQSGVEVVLTRHSDVYVPLEERTAIANRQKADLFLSIHANASRNVRARGVETYFLNFASTPDAEAVAARENSASGRTMHNLPDIVKAIALNNKLDESRDFAAMVQDALVKRLSSQNRDLRNLGVKQAPFVVLIGAAMPSVLAEISFLTNPQEVQLLKSNGYRQKIAEALFDAVMRYQRALKAVSTVASQ